MTDPFAALFKDINQDYDAALSCVETDRDGIRHWRDLVFAQFRGYRPLVLYVSVPRGAAPPPLVVFIHGGGWQIGHPMVTNPVYAKLDPIGKLLRAGFAVARISYRLSAEGPFPIQLHDCKAAVRFLRNRAHIFGVDPDRFSAMGDSAGGHLAALIGLTAGRVDLEGEVGDKKGSSAVQAVVDWFGPAELLTMREQALPDGMKGHDDPDSPESRMVGGPLQQKREAARAASPVSYVSKSAPPFHIQHGTRDRLVPLAQSEVLHQALLAAGALLGRAVRGHRRARYRLPAREARKLEAGGYVIEALLVVCGLSWSITRLNHRLRQIIYAYAAKKIQAIKLLIIRVDLRHSETIPHLHGEKEPRLQPSLPFTSCPT
jgi:acetyl esterase/lipase